MHQARVQTDYRSTPSNPTQPDDDWLLFQQSGHPDFEINLPAEPSRSIEMIASMLGPQTIVRYHGMTPSVHFEVGYLIRPEHPMSRLASDRQIMDAARAGTLAHFALEAVSRAVVSDDPLTEDVSATSTLGDSARIGHVRLVITPSHIFHVVLIGDGDVDAMFQRMTDSFRWSS